MPAYVPPPEYLPARVVNELGHVAAEVYARLETEVAARVAALLREGLAAPDDLLMRQRALRELQAAARGLLDRLDPAMAEDMVRIAAEAGTRAALDQLRMLPSFDPDSLLGVGGATAIDTLVLDLTNRLGALEQRILRYPQDAYQRIIAGNTPAILAGLTGGVKAQQRAVARFLAEGITGFVDAAGRTWTIGTYAEMATRTAALRAWQDAAIGTMQATGVNLVSVVSGDTACSKCGAWTGRILSTDGTPAGTVELPHATEDHTVRVRIDATLDDARAAGLQHPNCRCALVAYLPGLSVAGAATSYDAQQEEHLVRQRELERDVRKAKRKLAANSDDTMHPDLQRKVKEAQKAVRDHLAETGLHRQRYREQLWFTDGHGRRREPGPAVEYRRGADPNPVERATFERLQQLGHRVTAIAPTRNAVTGTMSKTPDLYMDGALWEVKSLTSSTSNMLSARLRLAAQQSNRAVLDLTGSALPLGTALERLQHDAGRFGMAEVLLLISGGAYHLQHDEWTRRR